MENGDRIVVDLVQRKVDLDVPEDVLSRRRDSLLLDTGKSDEHGWLSIYRGLVGPVAGGAVLTD